GEVVQILGRAANVNDLECAAELSPMTRWQIGGTVGGADAEAPPMPFFGLGAGRRGGTLELSGVSFTDLANTRSISSGTLTVYYRDELMDAVGALASAVTSEADEIALPGSPAKGDLVQVGGEIVRIDGAGASGSWSVTRGAHGTS